MLRVRNYILKSDLINKNITILNIADIHSDFQKLDEALDYADTINVDIITIAGDLFDSLENSDNEKIVASLLKQDRKIFICLGNHDLTVFDRKGIFSQQHENRDLIFFNKLKTKKNIYVFLENKTVVEYEGVEFMAFNLPYSWYYEKKEAKEEFDKLFKDFLLQMNETMKFRILLLHSCNGLIIENRLLKKIPFINLILSGHNHAGQTPEFIQDMSKNNRGIINPFCKFFVKGSYGYWTNDTTSLILSNGLTKMGNGHGPKWLCRGMNWILKEDIEVINLKHGEKHNLILTNKEFIKRK